MFKSLTDKELSEIVNLLVDDLRQRLIALNMTINLTDAATDYVRKEGTDVTFGARPLRRAIQRLLEDPISDQILEGKWTSGSVIDVDFDEEAKELTFTAGSGSIPAPRKRDNIAAEAELLLQGYDLGNTGRALGGSGGGAMSGGAAD